MAEEIRKAKSVIMSKKRDREGSAPVRARAQQLLSRNEVECDQHDTHCSRALSRNEVECDQHDTHCSRALSRNEVECDQHDTRSSRALNPYEGPKR